MEKGWERALAFPGVGGCREEPLMGLPRNCETLSRSFSFSRASVFSSLKWG